MDISDFDFSDFINDGPDNPNDGPLFEPPKWRMIAAIIVLLATMIYALFELGSFVYGLL